MIYADHVQKMQIYAETAKTHLYPNINSHPHLTCEKHLDTQASSRISKLYLHCTVGKSSALIERNTHKNFFQLALLPVVGQVVERLFKLIQILEVPRSMSCI